MKRAVVSLVVAACHHADAPPADCQVELSGNYVESSASQDDCPTLAPGAGATAGDTLLQFKLASPAIHSHFEISLDLGPSPSSGTYNSATTALWSATAVKPVAPEGGCVFRASNNATPTGDFTLELQAVEHATAHGTLALRLFVLPRTADSGAQTNCGPGTTEDLRVRF
jgi:hypothetical protein